jgi:hypothetical protein
VEQADAPTSDAGDADAAEDAAADPVPVSRRAAESGRPAPTVPAPAPQAPAVKVTPELIESIRESEPLVKALMDELGAQIIKVDRRFVAGVATDASDFAVARAVVDMARAMGRSCVAEGVETATQFHVLRSVGVEAYQGWLLSRPMPATDFRELLRMGPLTIPRD